MLKSEKLYRSGVHSRGLGRYSTTKPREAQARIGGGDHGKGGTERGVVGAPDFKP